MEAITTALAAQQAALSGLLVGLDEPEWHRDSRCAGWTVADVVLHLAQTNELALGSITGRFAEAMDELTRVSDRRPTSTTGRRGWWHRNAACQLLTSSPAGRRRPTS